MRQHQPEVASAEDTVTDLPQSGEANFRSGIGGISFLDDSTGRRRHTSQFELAGLPCSAYQGSAVRTLNRAAGPTETPVERHNDGHGMSSAALLPSSFRIVAMRPLIREVSFPARSEFESPQKALQQIYRRGCATQSTASASSNHRNVPKTNVCRPNGRGNTSIRSGFAENSRNRPSGSLNVLKCRNTCDPHDEAINLRAR